LSILIQSLEGSSTESVKTIMAKLKFNRTTQTRQGFAKHQHSMNPDRKPEGLKGVAKPRDKATIKRLQMYRNFKAKRNRKGKIIRAAPFQSTTASGTMARIEPNKKWFCNSKTISQNSLQKFQEEMGKAMKDPYKV